MLSDHGAERFVRTIIDAEAASGYALVRRIPSTYTWKIVDYVAALDPAERDVLFGDFASNALSFIRPGRDPNLQPYRAGRPAYKRLVDSMPLMGDWKYMDARSLRMMLAVIRNEPSSSLANAPKEVIARAEAIQPTTSAAIRREVKSRMADTFGVARPQNDGGGVWSYSGQWQGRPFKLEIDYGGRGDQLRYDLSWDDEELGLHARRLNYEWLTGFGQGRWDYVTADNLAESVTLLVELVERLVSIPDAIRAQSL